MTLSLNNRKTCKPLHTSFNSQRKVCISSRREHTCARPVETKRLLFWVHWQMSHVFGSLLSVADLLGDLFRTPKWTFLEVHRGPKSDHKLPEKKLYTLPFAYLQLFENAINDAGVYYYALTNAIQKSISTSTSGHWKEGLMYQRHGGGASPQGNWIESI